MFHIMLMYFKLNIAAGLQMFHENQIFHSGCDENCSLSYKMQRIIFLVKL